MAIKIYVVFHRNPPVLCGDCLVPILSTRTDGDNIANKENYCELRAHYWVWKNTNHGNSDDYIGFFHYRRYLDFKYRHILDCKSVKRCVAYRIRKWPEFFYYTSNYMESIMSGVDAIAPIWEYTGVTVKKRYAEGKGQRGQDLDIIRTIIAEHYPEYLDAADHYLNGKGEYYGNIFLLRSSLFDAYCVWVFDILSEFDRRVKSVPPRTNGYLGERLFGIYFTWLNEQNKVLCGEIPRIHFWGYDEKKRHSIFSYFINMIFPPGTQQRALLRRIVKERCIWRNEKDEWKSSDC